MELFLDFYINAFYKKALLEKLFFIIIIYLGVPKLGRARWLFAQIKFVHKLSVCLGLISPETHNCNASCFGGNDFS